MSMYNFRELESSIDRLTENISLRLGFFFIFVVFLLYKYTAKAAKFRVCQGVGTTFIWRES